MTALRQRMIEDMELRGLAKTTQRSYLHYVTEYARYFHRDPATLDLEAVREHTLHLIEERSLSAESINTSIAALKFLYLVTLEMPWRSEDFPPRQRVPGKMPTVLSPQEVLYFLDCIAGVKNRTVLTLCYGAGLRISEAVALKVTDIDSQRMVIHISAGKGNRARTALLSPRLLAILRAYYRLVRPQFGWMFPSWRKKHHYSSGAVQQACRDALAQSGLTKRVTPHTLRHSFATHLLESGEEMRVIQALLGHRSITSTAYYTAVTPARLAKTMPPLDALLGPPPPSKPRRKRTSP